MKTWIAVILGALMVLLVVGVLFFWLVYQKPHPDYEAMPAEHALSAGELYTAFITNEEAAHQQYIGSVVQIEGALSQVEQPRDLVIVGFYFDEGIFGQAGVRCTMLEHYQQQALQLVPGQGVIIRGLVTGFTGSDVILDHCVIEWAADQPPDDTQS